MRHMNLLFVVNPFAVSKQKFDFVYRVLRTNATVGNYNWRHLSSEIIESASCPVCIWYILNGAWVFYSISGIWVLKISKPAVFGCRILFCFGRRTNKLEIWRLIHWWSSLSLKPCWQIPNHCKMKWKSNCFFLWTLYMYQGNWQRWKNQIKHVTIWEIIRRHRQKMDYSRRWRTFNRI